MTGAVFSRQARAGWRRSGRPAPSRWGPPRRSGWEPDSGRQLEASPLRELARRTGLSVAYCVLIRRGEEVPHARW
jgi:hypothetical protein